MKRRELPVGLLPPELRDFDPRKWLKPAEDETDPIRCHVTALFRYKEAVRSATGVRDPHDVAAAVIDRWYGPLATRKPGECPCSHCGTVQAIMIPSEVSFQPLRALPCR
jgi:hypothetical protein